MVAAIDGLAIQTRTPPKNKFKNTARFMSGAKKKVSFNMQAVWDASCKLTAFACKHVGCTNDVHAFETSALKRLNQSLPFPYHFNGDNAYTQTETMMSLFPGQNLHITAPHHETFNFYHSQVRIIAERGNGIFVRRWGILWKPMEFDTLFQIEIIHCLALLHNFCIDRSIPILNNAGAVLPAIINMDDEGRLLDARWREGLEAAFVGDGSGTGCTLRNYIVDEIKANNYRVVRSHNRK
jgi:hypothetical protein